MHEDDDRRAALALPFRLRGFGGQVTVYYEEDRDPARWGFAVPGLLSSSFDLTLAKGFPVCEARIEYQGKGYHGVMGWIQLITQYGPDGSVMDEPSPDVFPIHADLNTPFMVAGYCPTMFDAPANPDHPDMDWSAETFLAVCPDVARTRQVAALLGFNWGYRLREHAAMPLPIKRSGPEAWDRILPPLRESFPGWEFLPGYPAL